MHLVITDSGLGGLLICARVERALREARPARDARLTYVNAWPEQGRGYNDLPGMPERAATFDRVLQHIARIEPALILVACNTLSIVFEHTAFRRSGSVPVKGIVDAGVNLFAEALDRTPGSGIVLMGTRTTIQSGVHRDRLMARGIAAERILPVPCHGLAAAIEQGPEAETVRTLIERCLNGDAHLSRWAGTLTGSLFGGLCCTHYGMVAGRIRDAIARSTGRDVIALDPNERLVQDVLPRLVELAGGRGGGGHVRVEVVSKVALADDQRASVARVVDQLSPATAQALRAYSRVPDLF